MALHHTYQTQGAQCPCQCIHREQTARQSFPYSACNPHSVPWFRCWREFPSSPMNRFLRFVGPRRPASHRKVSHVFFVNVSAAAGRVNLFLLIRFTASSASLNIIPCVFSSPLSLFSAKSQAITGHNAFPSRIAKEYWIFFFKNQGASKTKASHWSQYGWTSPAAAWRLGSRSIYIYILYIYIPQLQWWNIATCNISYSDILHLFAHLCAIHYQATINQTLPWLPKSTCLCLTWKFSKRRTAASQSSSICNMTPQPPAT